MLVEFVYNDGRKVRMQRVYADILSRIKHGVIHEAAVQKVINVAPSDDSGQFAVLSASPSIIPTSPTTVTNQRQGQRQGGRGRGNRGSRNTSE